MIDQEKSESYISRRSQILFTDTPVFPAKIETVRDITTCRGID